MGPIQNRPLPRSYQERIARQELLLQTTTNQRLLPQYGFQVDSSVCLYPTLDQNREISSAPYPIDQTSMPHPVDQQQPSVPQQNPSNSIQIDDLPPSFDEAMANSNYFSIKN